jgi:Aspartyl protease
MKNNRTPKFKRTPVISLLGFFCYLLMQDAGSSPNTFGKAADDLQGISGAVDITPSRRATKAAPYRVIPLLSYVGPQLVLKVQAHGHQGLMLFDSGGGITTVTPEFAALIGCKPWGQITGFRMRGDRVDTPRCDHATFALGDLRVTAPTAAVFDLSKVTPKDAPSLEGSLALDVFANRAVTIDLRGHVLIIETPASLKERIRGATEGSVRFGREAAGLALSPFVAIDTPLGQLWMELDTGSDGKVVAGRHVASALGLNPEDTHGQSLTLNLSGGVQIQTRAIIKDLIMDGNIGVPALEPFVITIDLVHQRIWINSIGS